MIHKRNVFSEEIFSKVSHSRIIEIFIPIKNGCYCLWLCMFWLWYLHKCPVLHSQTMQRCSNFHKKQLYECTSITEELQIKFTIVKSVVWHVNPMWHLYALNFCCAFFLYIKYYFIVSIAYILQGLLNIIRNSDFLRLVLAGLLSNKKWCH